MRGGREGKEKEGEEKGRKEKGRGGVWPQLQLLDLPMYI